MINSAPLVCICIPTYNAEKTIGEMLASVLKQTYENFKVIVIDNASTDLTLDILESFKDPRLTIHRNEVNVGAVGNFDKCIELSDGEYTEMLHADEVYKPDMVRQQVGALLAFPDAGAVFTEAELIDSKSRCVGETQVASYIGRERGQVVSLELRELLPMILRNGNFLLCSGALVRSKIYKTEIKRFDFEKFKTSCDLDVWLRILERHKIAFVLNKLMQTRSSETQASFTELKRNTNRADMFLVLDFYLKKFAPSAFFDKRDLQLYEALHRMDMTRRAMNLFLQGDFEKSKALLAEISKTKMIRFLFHSKRGFLTFSLASYLSIAMGLGLQSLGQPILRWVVQKTRR